jgi:NAD(P)-dependent dehydrogenase (short-subunit alcohol dehydrogenase family)
VTSPGTSRVVITGSTQGIGRGLAEEFCRRGHSVVIAGRDQERIGQVLQGMESLPGKALGQTCDVADHSQVQALWDLGVRELGGIDIWINNAGLARTVWPILEVPQSDVETMVRTNMLGTINGCRVALVGMRAQGSGKLFNMLGGGSDGEYFPGMGIYGTTKRGLDYFTRALVKEMAETSIIIGKIRPGMIITEAVVREVQADPEGFAKSRRIMNNMVDTVETVSPFLVDQILAVNKSGLRIRWLTPGKIRWRFFSSVFLKRDIFTPLEF